MNDPDPSISARFEENHAFWWTADGIREGQARDLDPRYYWTLHPEEGWASLHKVRLGASDAESVVEDLVARCVGPRVAIHAHIGDLATPDDLLARLRPLGFQHLRKFPVFARDLSAVAPEPPRNLRFERIEDLSRFDEESPHPATGPVDRPARRKILRQIEDRMATVPGQISHHVAWQEKRAVGSFHLVRAGGIAGFYDPSIAEGIRDQALEAALLQAAAFLAAAEGFDHLALICDRHLEPTLREQGFDVHGWISWLHISKTKLAKIAAGSKSSGRSPK